MDREKIKNYGTETGYDDTLPLLSEKDPFEISDPPFKWRSNVLKKELKTNLKMSFPVLLTNLMQYMVNIETMSFCGRLSVIELDGVGFGISLVSAFGWYVCTGMATSCDTMFAQAFGSDDKKRTGLFLQRGLLMLNLVPFVLWAFHCNMEPILILLYQDPSIAKVTGEFIISMMPGILFMMNYVILARYMQDQGCLWPPFFAGLCGNLFNICSQLLLVTYLGYGYRVAGLCHAFSFAVMIIFELAYIFKSRFYVPTWPGFQLESLYDWSHMFKLGLGGVGHLTFEVLVWEITIFLAGLLSPLSLATQSVLIQVVTVMSMMFYGFGLVCNIRVGQCLGANKPNHAKTAYRAGMINSGVFVVILTIILISLRYQVPYIFTDKQDAIDMIIAVFPAIFPLLFIDAFSGVCSASLRGCGRQAIGGLIIFISLYLIAIPMSALLAFLAKMDVLGFWIGNSSGAFVAMVLVFLILECQSWKKQANLAQKRITKGYTVVMNSTGIIDKKASLSGFEVDEESLERVIGHIRTPSHPVTCSIEVVHIPEPRTDIERSIVLKKIITALCAVTFFLFGLSIHLFLPTAIYRPFNVTNH